MNAVTRIELPSISPQMRAMMADVRDITRRMQAMQRAVEKGTAPLSVMGGAAVEGSGIMAKMSTTFRNFSSKLRAQIAYVVPFLGPGARLISAGLSTISFVATSAATFASTLFGIGALVWNSALKLGDAMAADHIESLTTGSSFSGMLGFRSVFQTVSADPTGLLQRVREARLDQLSGGYIALHVLKVRETGDTVAMTVAAMMAAARLLRSFREDQTLPLARSYRLTSLFSEDEIRTLRELSEEELQGYAEKLKKAAIPMVSKEARQGLVQLRYSIAAAGQAITTAIEDKLASSGFIQLLGTVSLTLSKAIKTFIDSKPVGEIVEKLKGFLSWLGGELESGKLIEAIKQAEIEFRTKWLPMVSRLIDMVRAVSAAFGLTIGPKRVTYARIGGDIASADLGEEAGSGTVPSIRYGRRPGGRASREAPTGAGGRQGGAPAARGGVSGEEAPAAGGPSAGGSGALQPMPGRSPDIAHVDPRLVEIVGAATKHLPAGYTVKVVEGYNPRGHVGRSQHHIMGAGALDMMIYGPDGRPISNRGGDPTGMYHRLARAAYGEMRKRHPELQGKFAWGGAFGTVTGGTTSDLMHFDIGGERGFITENLLSRMGELPGEHYGVDAAPALKPADKFDIFRSDSNPLKARPKVDHVTVNDQKVKIVNHADDHDVTWKMDNRVSLAGGI